jgi:hypothetical protein
MSEEIAEDRLMLVARMREALAGVMEIESYSVSERMLVTLRGQLLVSADQIYRELRKRFEALGYTPLLRARREQHELLAIPGVEVHPPQRFVLPLVLFVLTVLSTLLTGALSALPQCLDSEAALFGAIWQILTTPALLLTGLPFSATLLGILFAHEMGHYIVGRRRQAPVSLPYFIPLPPPISIIGTMGAVIVQREPMEDRRTTLEVGIAGPLAGLVVAVPLLFYGLSISQVGAPLPPSPGCPAVYLQEGNSIFYAAAKLALFGQILPAGGVDVQLSPVAWAAWIGLLVTMLNLMPVGQFDGGHVAYALLGDRAIYLAYATVGMCLFLGVFVNNIWFFWAILAMLVGVRHPPPLNDISRLRGAHIGLAVLGLVVFVLLFMPNPLVTFDR